MSNNTPASTTHQGSAGAGQAKRHDDPCRMNTNQKPCIEKRIIERIGANPHLAGLFKELLQMQ